MPPLPRLRSGLGLASRLPAGREVVPYREEAGTWPPPDRPQPVQRGPEPEAGQGGPPMPPSDQGTALVPSGGQGAPQNFVDVESSYAPKPTEAEAAFGKLKDQDGAWAFAGQEHQTLMEQLDQVRQLANQGHVSSMTATNMIGEAVGNYLSKAGMSPQFKDAFEKYMQKAYGWSTGLNMARQILFGTPRPSAGLGASMKRGLSEFGGDLGRGLATGAAIAGPAAALGLAGGAYMLHQNNQDQEKMFDEMKQKYGAPGGGPVSGSPLPSENRQYDQRFKRANY